MAIKKNDKVKVHYVGSLNDGTIFDKSPEGQPLEFVIGKGEIIPGFENALLGMNVNEEKKVTVKSQEAYGPRDEKLIKDFPKSMFPKDFVPQKGLNIFMVDQEGRNIPATVLGATNETVKIDLNHPLAGRDLNFTIKIVRIEG